MATYPFLSDEWVTEARHIREEHMGKSASVPHSVRMNLIIIEAPFGDAPIDAHLDTTEGDLHLDTGHIDPVDLTVTVDYETAKSILVDGNPAAGMQAFMAGKIKVEGDIAKLMAIQSGPADPNAADMAQRLKAITD
jgi:putative sterol carrier protein